MNQSAMMPDEVITRVQLVRYILEKLGGFCHSLKLVKLIALADIYALRLDGATITGDVYVALKKGPAPSVTSDMIGFDTEYVDSAVLDYVSEYIQKRNTEISLKEKDVEYEYLSHFEKKCIDYVVQTYGHLSAEDLIDGNNGENVHAFKAWKKHGIHAFGPGQVATISLEDFFENDGPVQVDEKDLKKARERYLYGDF